MTYDNYVTRPRAGKESGSTSGKEIGGLECLSLGVRSTDSERYEIPGQQETFLHNFFIPLLEFLRPPRSYQGRRIEQYTSQGHRRR